MHTVLQPFEKIYLALPVCSRLLSSRGVPGLRARLSPVAGSSGWWSRMGSQFDLFLFYCSPLEKFFDFKNTIFRRPFLTPRIFYCDGRWMGSFAWPTTWPTMWPTAWPTAWPTEWPTAWPTVSKKKFSDFAQNFFRWSSGDINLPLFRFFVTSCL